jgi:hypothetical protein
MLSFQLSMRFASHHDNPPIQRSMSTKPLHPGRPTLAAAFGLLGTLILTGCQAIVSSAPEAQVRIIHATSDTSGLDIYQGPNALAFNLGFGSVTSYIPLTPGVYTINADNAGSKQVLSAAKTTFAPATQYTVLLGNSAASLQQLTLTDQSQPAPAGQIALRFIHQATRTSAVDIYLIPAGQKLTAVAPLITGVIFGTNTGYLNVPTGIYSLIMLPTGTGLVSGTSATYTGPQVTYSVGSARTIILIDQPVVTTPGIQVITAADFDPTGVTN